MSTKPLCTQRAQRELNTPPPDEGAEGQKPGREEEAEEDEEERDWRPSSLCPSCGGEYDVAVLLPCSHTVCGRCVSHGEVLALQGHFHEGSAPAGPLRHSRRRRRATSSSLPPVCSVLCPGCHHQVELPCWGWASAVSCLPLDPTLTPAGSSSSSREGNVSAEGVSETALLPLHNSRCSRTGGVLNQCSLHGSNQATSLTSPAEGGIDLQEDEMERSVLGLCFALDPSKLPPSLHLSNSFLTVTFRGRTPPLTPPASHHSSREVRGSASASDLRVTSTALPCVCADVVITRGQYYWEVDVCNSNLYQIGVTSLDGSGGWWLERRDSSFWAVYDGGREVLRAVPPRLAALGVFLNVGGGSLSFSNPLTREHLATLPTRFGPAGGGVLPALGLGQGRLRLRCGLPPPPHVFVGRTSAYRGPPRGAGGGRWRRDVPFRSVRTVIQRFEEMAVSDADSGLASNLGSSCSTLDSLPDHGGQDRHGQGRAENVREAGADISKRAFS